MYAHYKKLVYFSTECVFAPNAYRGHARALLKDMEKIRPTCIMDIIYSGETMAVKEEVTLPSQRICMRCKFVSSQEVCKACVLLEGLNKGLPRLGIGKSSKAKKMLEEYNAKLPRGNELDNIKDESQNNSKSKDKCKNKVNKNKENCGNCSGKCGKETNITDETNSKINNLLKEYGLETSNTANIPTSNQHESDEEQILNEDDGCSGACGKLGSMQIGF